MTDPFAPPGLPVPPPVPPPAPLPAPPQQAYGQPYPQQPYVQQPYFAPAPPAPRRTWVVVLVTALVAGLVGVLLGVAGTLAVQSLDEPGDSGTDDGRQAADVVPERLPELVSWIEDRTGREFDSVPEVVVLADEEFEEALLAPVPEGTVEPESLPTDDWTATVTALGLVTDPDAFDAYAEDGFADGVVGFYDATDGIVRVRGTQWNPMVEVTLLHELVHALQDQVVDLDAVTARTAYYDETYQALSAVIEGQATVVEQDWLLEQGADYTARYYESGPAGGAYEPFGAAMSWLPYDLGGWAVSVLEGSEGPQAGFDAMTSPPTSLEQLWDMEGWRDGDAEEADPVDVPDPAQDAGTDVLDRGSLGVHVLSLLTIEDPDEYTELPYEEELPLEGWAGDEYVTWADGDRACTRVTVATDSAQDASAMVDDLRDWAADGASVGADGSQVLIQRCADY